MKNKQVIINSLPEGKLTESNYRLVESEIPEISSDQVLVKTISFAITAGTRAGLQGSASYAGAPTTGIVMNCTGIGEIVKSNSEEYPIGKNVLTQTGWQEYSAQNIQSLTLLRDTVAPSLYLGPLGINGLTAYFGLLEIGQPQEAYEYYQRAFKTNENKFSTPKYLFKAAMIGVGLGKTTQALEYFKRIKEEFPTSKEAQLVDVQIGRLEQLQ